MTIIAGLVDRDGEVWMGADSRTTYGWNSVATKGVPKIFFKGDDYLIGGCGAVRAIQCMKYEVNLPELRPSVKTHEDVEKFIATEIIPAIRNKFGQVGLIKVTEGIVSLHHTMFLLGIKGQLWMLFEDLSFLRATRDIAAIGSGERLALGVLYACCAEEEQQGVTPPSSEAIISLALDAAVEFDNACAPPYFITNFSKLKSEANGG